jgi:hypothetical protein
MSATSSVLAVAGSEYSVAVTVVVVAVLALARDLGDSR